MAIFSRWVKSPTEAVSAGSKVIHTHFSSLSRLSKEQLEVTAQAWQQYSMQNLMVGERGFIEEIKAPIFLEAVLAIETIQMSLFNLEEKWNLNFLDDDFFIQDPSFSTSAIPQLLERLKETNRLFPALLTYWQQATFCPSPQCFVGQKLTLAVVTN